MARGKSPPHHFYSAPEFNSAPDRNNHEGSIPFTRSNLINLNAIDGYGK